MRPLQTTLIALSLIAGAPALAQTTPTGTPSTNSGTSAQSPGGQEAVTRPNTDRGQPGNPQATGSTNAQLEPGANSFTEGQVRSRLEQAGFSQVRELRKDDQGIWRGKAMQNGKSVTVGFDFKGNVQTQ